MSDGGRRSLGPRIARRLWRHARRILPARPRPTILMYHRIADEAFDPWGLAVTPERFGAHLRWLADNRTVLALADFAAMHRQGSLPQDAIAVTFDDAYACNAQVAAPLLERSGIPATIFLPVALIERGGGFWWDELQALALHPELPSLRVGNVAVPLGEKRDADGNWRPGKPPRTLRQAAFERLWSLLRPLNPDQLDEAMASLRAQAGGRPAPDPSKRPMNAAEVRSTASASIQFGSHALNHPWLTSLGPSAKAHEIVDSIGRCEAMTGSRPAAFAYPYGNFDEESEQLVEAAGFALACATGGTAVTPRSSLYALPRMQVGNWDSARLARALSEIAP